MKSLIKYSSLIALAIVAIGFPGCDDDEELPEVIAGFTHTFDQETGQVTFLNISENASNYEWDFGDGETSTEINPIKTYSDGTYTVVLNASNKAGATETFQDELTLDVIRSFTLPLSFDDGDVVYDISTVGGATFAFVNNPELSGTNNKESQVIAIVNSGAENEGVVLNLEGGIDLSTESIVALNFRSNVAVPITMELSMAASTPETRTLQETTQATANHTGSGWEIIEFDFDSKGEFDIMTLFVDKAGTTSGVFYFDDTQQGADFDKTPPVIMLIGESTINLNEGGTFTDEGATATDDMDGDISSKIVVGGDVVDVNTVGTYEITYNVADAFGNAAAEVIRTVNIFDASVDITPPVITLNGDATVNVIVGDAYTEEGATATDAVDGTLTVVIGGDMVDTNTAGMYTVTYTATDASNNSAEAIRTVNVSSNDVTLGDELLTNGDFQTGMASPWTGNGGDPEVRTEGESSFFFADIATANPDMPFAFGFQQAVTLDQDEDYVLTFTASTSTEDSPRTINVGIGINVEPFTDTDEREIMLTDVNQTFTLNLSSDEFSSSTARLFFDLAGETGIVVIDDVSLKQVVSSGGSGGSGGSGSGDAWCNEEITHFGGDAGSEIIVSVFNVDASTMRIEIESADNDPVDALVFPAGDWTPSNAGISSAPAAVGNGVWAGEFFFPDNSAPETLEFYFLWSKESFEGNWSSVDNNNDPLDSVPFDNTCN